MIVKKGDEKNVLSLVMAVTSSHTYEKGVVGLTIYEEERNGKQYKNKSV